MKRLPLLLPMLLGATLAFGEPAGKATPAPELKAGVLSPVMAAPEMRLGGTDGKPLSLAAYRGKVVLLAFGFSNCGEVCPITLATLAGARRKLGADAGRVQVVYVTVDPERDTAEQMKKYLAAFDPTFIGGGVTNGSGRYTIGHSSSIYMIDRAGGLRAVMPYGRTVDDFVHDLKILLRS
jgi:protein SCO1/2